MRIRLAGLLRLGTAAVAFLMMPGAFARTLTVGEGETYAHPSDAARVAQPGDRIRILPGTYYDCAVWSVDGLVIEGSGPSTVLTDTACQGKAIFVMAGRGAMVRDLVLARVRVTDGNGAGIRAEGPDLIVQRVRFEDNQNGLLAADQPSGMLRIEDCTFVGNGVADASRPTAALLVGSWARLIVRDTRFEQGRGEATILSHAAVTEVDGSRIAGPEASGGAAVQASGGLIVERSTLQAGRGSHGRRAAILALPGGPDAPLIVRHNLLQGEGTLLLNWSGRDAQIEANQVDAGSAVESTSGAWSHRLRSGMRDAYGAAHAMAGALRRHATDWLHWR